jgi:ligand-binding sensor domain-containing protein
MGFLPRDKYPYSKADIVLLPRSEEGARVGKVAFGKDGSLAVGLSNGRVLLWQQPFATEAAPTWETVANGAHITALNFDTDGNLWIGNAGGQLHTRNAKTGELQSVLSLTPPTSTSEGASPGWVRWNRNGSIDKSP